MSFGFENLFTAADLAKAAGVNSQTVRWHQRNTVKNATILISGNPAGAFLWENISSPLKRKIKSQAASNGFDDPILFIRSKQNLANRKPISGGGLPNISLSKKNTTECKRMFLEMMRKYYLDGIIAGMPTKPLRRQINKIAWKVMWDEQRCPWPTPTSFYRAARRMYDSPGLPVRDRRINNGREKQQIEKPTTRSRPVNLLAAMREIQNETRETTQ